MGDRRASRLVAVFRVARRQSVSVGCSALAAVVLVCVLALLLLVWNLCVPNAYEVGVMSVSLWAFWALVLYLVLVFSLGKQFRAACQALYHESLAAQLSGFDPDECVRHSASAVSGLEIIAQRDSRMLSLLINCCHNVATYARQTGRYAETEVFRQKQLRFAMAGGSLTQKAEALLGLGQLRIRQCRWDEAERFLQEAATIASQTGNSTIYSWILDTLGEVVHFRGRPAEASDLCRKALSVYTSRDEHMCLIKAHLVAAHRDTGRFSEATFEAIDSLRLGRMGPGSAEHLVLTGLGPLLLVLEDHDQAYEVAWEAARINRCEADKDSFSRSVLLPSALAILGLTVDAVGPHEPCPLVPSHILVRRMLRGPYSADLQYPMVQETILAGVARFRYENDSTQDLFDFLFPAGEHSTECDESLLALLDSFQGKWEKLDHFVASGTPAGNRRLLTSETLSRTAVLLDRRGISARAIPWHRYAEKRARHEGNQRMVVAALLRMGNSFKRIDDLGSAIDSYRKAAEQPESDDLGIEWNASMFELAVAYERQGSYDDAVAVLDDLLSVISPDTSAVGDTVDSLLVRARCLAKAGRTKESIGSLHRTIDVIRQIQESLAKAGLRTRVKAEKAAEAFEHLVNLYVRVLNDLRAAVEIVESARLWDLSGGDWMPSSQIVRAGWRIG